MLDDAQLGHDARVYAISGVQGSGKSTLAAQDILALKPPGFEVVPGWRRQQDRALQAANPGQQVMVPLQVERFVQWFEQDQPPRPAHVARDRRAHGRGDARRRPSGHL